MARFVVTSTAAARGLAAVLCLIPACGPDEKQPDPPPQPTGVEAPPPPPPSDTATGPASAVPTSTVPPPPTSDRPPPSGRPAIMMGPSDSIKSTFGATPGSILKLKGTGGNYTLVLPEYALGTGTNIEWSIAARGEKKPPLIGQIVYLHSQLGESLIPGPIQSRGAPFTLRWPLMGKDTFNLAIGEIEVLQHGNLGKVKTWRVIAPARVEKGLDEVHFELTALLPAYLYATDAPVAP